MKQDLIKALLFLDKVRTFNGHHDVLEWYNDPATADLIEQIDSFVDKTMEKFDENGNLQS